MPKSLPSAGVSTAIRNRFAKSRGAPAGVFAMLAVVLVAMVSASPARDERIVPAAKPSPDSCDLRELQSLLGFDIRPNATLRKREAFPLAREQTKYVA